MEDIILNTKEDINERITTGDMMLENNIKEDRHRHRGTEDQHHTANDLHRTRNSLHMPGCTVQALYMHLTYTAHTPYKHPTSNLQAPYKHPTSTVL